LLYRILQASSNPGDVVLDPFFGTGTTGVVAKRLFRHWVGIERETRFVDLARQRINETPQNDYNAALFETPNPRKRRRVPFGTLVEYGFVQPGQMLYFGQTGETTARILADGAIECDGQRGSIHQVAKELRQAPCNGWEQWYYLDEQTGERLPINHLREIFRAKYYKTKEEMREKHDENDVQKNSLES
jgi:modification methylase